jgi:type II restriction enzyme
MRLELNVSLAAGYKSPSQRARVVTEGWFAANMYCPACPSPHLNATRGSAQVVDFLCDSCGAEYQVKAKASRLGPRLRDAAYRPMIERARENRSPHFAFLGYDSKDWTVRGLLLVPGHFITPEVIERCRPLSESARRAGWVGCNILAGLLPADGRVVAIQDGRVMPAEKVRAEWRRFADLADAEPEQRGWTVDVLRCVRMIGRREFTLREFRDRFEAALGALHPKNKHVRFKIQQQLQKLRDRSVLRFLGRGRYVVE